MSIYALNLLLSGISASLITIFGGIWIILSYCRNPDIIEDDVLLLNEMN